MKAITAQLPPFRVGEILLNRRTADLYQVIRAEPGRPVLVRQLVIRTIHTPRCWLICPGDLFGEFITRPKLFVVRGFKLPVRDSFRRDKRPKRATGAFTLWDGEEVPSECTFEPSGLC